MDYKNKGERKKETLKQGLVGGVLGAFVGAPGLGMALGAANANRDKIKEFGKNVDESFQPRDGTGPHGRGLGPGKGKYECRKRAIDDPGSFF